MLRSQKPAGARAGDGDRDGEGTGGGCPVEEGRERLGPACSTLGRPAQQRRAGRRSRIARLTGLTGQSGAGLE